jgi:hypothetical protein
MTNDLGVEAKNDDDVSYRGSRFSEIRDTIFANPYQRVCLANRIYQFIQSICLVFCGGYFPSVLVTSSCKRANVPWTLLRN